LGVKGPAVSDLSKYEAWLDTLDEKLFVQGRSVVCQFGPGLKIPLSICSSEEGIIEGSIKLARTLDQHFESLPIKYLTERFIRLVLQANSLPANSDELMTKVTMAVEHRKDIWLPPGA
jgi:hypothetical protein